MRCSPPISESPRRRRDGESTYAKRKKDHNHIDQGYEIGHHNFPNAKENFNSRNPNPRKHNKNLIKHKHQHKSCQL